MFALIAVLAALYGFVSLIYVASDTLRNRANFDRRDWILTWCLGIGAVAVLVTAAGVLC